MKNFKRFTAAIAATLMAATLSVPMAMSSSAAGTSSITISGISTNQEHTFEVYQILTGKVQVLTTGEAGEAVDKIFVDAKWGSGIKSFNSADVTAGDAVSDTDMNILKNTDARALVNGADAKIVLKNGTGSCTTIKSSSGSAVANDLEEGYYVIKDVTNLDNKGDANSAWIVQVLGKEEITIKNAMPSVDKQVSDEKDPYDTSQDGNTIWGETADHAINESFQFKLTATIPNDPDLAAYDTYKLVFNDTMSDGVTFDGIQSVMVGETELKDSQYTETATGSRDKAGLSWTLTIADVKEIAGASFGTSNLTVEVIYKAHLNENAIITGADYDGAYSNGTAALVNNNNVYLTYSNNPDSTGTGTDDMGKTPDDTVGVFTYQSVNTKYADAAEEGKELAGAKFKLYDAATGGNEIELKKEGDKYMPIVAGGTGVEMESGTDGKFTIVGLDAGTYYLEETEAPAGYNKLTTRTPITIKVEEHKENADGNVVMKFGTEANGHKPDATIINKAGSTLPSTGGIGTTLFYLAGGAMVAVAGIFLITKKRMNKDAE